MMMAASFCRVLLAKRYGGCDCARRTGCITGHSPGLSYQFGPTQIGIDVEGAVALHAITNIGYLRFIGEDKQNVVHGPQATRNLPGIKLADF